jgi:hypothetical protein
MRLPAFAEGSTMHRTVAIGFLAAALCAAPLKAEPASPETPAILKRDNDATLRPPLSAPPPRRPAPIIDTAPTNESAPTDQPRR